MSSVTTNSEAAIFSRLIDAAGSDLTPDVARHILNINFSDADRSRMHELVTKNQDGDVSEEEQTELENYNHVGDLLSLWHSKARTVLKAS